MHSLACCESNLCPSRCLCLIWARICLPFIPVRSSVMWGIGPFGKSCVWPVCGMYSSWCAKVAQNGLTKLHRSPDTSKILLLLLGCWLVRQCLPQDLFSSSLCLLAGGNRCLSQPFSWLLYSFQWLKKSGHVAFSKIQFRCFSLCPSHAINNVVIESEINKRVEWNLVSC